MNKKKSGGPAAVIEIGSSAVRMRISQLRHGTIETLDELNYPVFLGHEVFNDGRISFESLRQLSSILTKFKSALSSFGCSEVKVVSSTVMREASNRFIVTDQLKIHNNLNLEILEYSAEKSLICSEIIRILQEKYKSDIENTMIAYIGTGSIGLALYDGKVINSSVNIPIGSLKLHDTLRVLNRESDEFYPVVEEYLDIILDRVALPFEKTQNLILTGSDLNIVASACGAEKQGSVFVLSSKKLYAAYKELRSMSYAAAARRYNISEENAELLFTALSIYTGILRLAGDPQKVICPDIDICDAVTRHMLEPQQKKEYDMQAHNNAIASAYRIAEKYNCNRAHGEAAASFASVLFDKLKNYHGIETEKRILLELAAILHSCGQYVNVRNHSQCSFDLIKNMDIFGLTHEEILETAYISGYGESFSYETTDTDFFKLPAEKRLEISKLVAIFRLANALDKSKRQKLEIIKIKIAGDKLQIKADAKENALLEKWAFEESAVFFKEVFGLSPELHLRNNLL